MTPLRCFVLSAIVLLNSPLAWSQTEKIISYSCLEKPLVEVVKEWEGTLDISFSYESGILTDDYITISISELPLSQAVEQLFAHTRIQCEVVSDRYLVLQRRVGQPLPYSLCGRLIDASTQEPLIYANIHVQGTTIGTNSDEQGNFSLDVSPGAQQLVEISYLGYKALVLSIHELRQKPCRTWTLESDAQMMPEIIVQDFTVDMLELSESPPQITFQPKKIPTLPGWGEPDILRSLQLLPGISSADESASRLHIRGGTSDQNLLLWDGIPIYHAGHFFGLYSAFNPYVVDQVDVYSGDFGVEYGDRLSGVIDISGKPDRVEKPHIGLGWNLINAHGFLELPLLKKKASLLLAARRSYTDLIQSSTYQNLFSRVFVKGRLSNNLEDRDENQEEILADPTFYYSDFNGKFAWDISEKDYLSASLYWGLDQFNYEFSVYEQYSTEDVLELSNRGASIQYERDWNTEHRTEAMGTYSLFTNDYNLAVKENLNVEETIYQSGNSNYLQDWGGKVVHTWLPSDRHEWTAGWQYSYKIATYLFTETEGEDTEEFGSDEMHVRTNSWFGSYQLNIRNRWALRFGLRRDGYRNYLFNEEPLREEVAWQPRLNVKWNPKEGPWTWYSAFGIYRQFLYQIPADFTDLGSGEKLWVVADDYFPSLVAAQLSIGVQFSKDQQLLDIAIYSKGIENLSSWNLDLEEDQENPFTLNGTLRASGLDVLWKNRWGRYSTWLGYSIGRVENRFPEINNDAFFPVDYDHRHQLNTTHMWSLKSWDFSLNWVYKSGKPYTEPIGTQVVQESLDEINLQYVYGQPNNRRLPAYQRLDIAINYKFSNDWWSGKIGLSVFNTFNRENLLDIDYVIFEPNLYDQEYYPELVSLRREMLSFTPNLFIQLEW